MPRGVPTIGSKFGEGAQVLGTITNDRLLDPTPQGTNTQWEGEAGSVSMSEPPPPWELAAEGGMPESDARRFVEVPENWTLRWINPKLLDQFGWRDWQPVMASDERVKVRVSTMVSPEGNIRRGGFTGDILAWMYTSWVISRRKLIQKETDQLTASAANKQVEVEDEIKRKFGGKVKIDSFRTPAYTMGDGASMRD